ncbi:MAG: DeoR family transcriptional regulator [Deltaproteobacteria bacterium]|nr:DeoR family transcriptional regulator [Deltaproteobacteria bacterium]
MVFEKRTEIFVEPMIDLKKKFNEMSVLSPLLTLYTLIYLGLMIYDFAAREKFDMPVGMMAVYIALVGAYSADKEIRRWMGNEAPSKGGAIFVYAWLVFFLVAFLIQSFAPTFTMPEDLTAVSLQVLGIFFGSKASKKIYELKTGKGEEMLSRQDTVLAMIKEKGKAAKRDIMEALKISDSTAGRLLDEMERKGAIIQVGQHKDTYYVVGQSANKAD